MMANASSSSSLFVLFPSSSSRDAKKSHTLFDKSPRAPQIACGINIGDFSREYGGNANRPLSLTLFSPCKIELTRADGKRQADSVSTSLFHAVSLGDTIEFSVLPDRAKDEVFNVSGVPIDEANLSQISRALELYRRKTRSKTSFSVCIKRKVRGVGDAGSSNAATALWAANELSWDPVSEERLKHWSSEVGPQVPFYFSHGTAYCNGKGEVVEAITSPVPFQFPVLMIKPKEGCSIVDVYSRLRLKTTTSFDPWRLIKNVVRYGQQQDALINDLETLGFQVLSSLKMLRKFMQEANPEQCLIAFVKESGGTIVGIGSLGHSSECKDAFLSEACFITREENEWYEDVNHQLLNTSSTNTTWGGTDQHLYM
ncbi:4-diphosphocytidyl-2-C-methyl-D-erythritol kinase, chloroplastic-like [Curcuma longa]|uniref:4-diphosphocytidyl-2-C-methyl-D-erythritol kinase, chloroplastic-like n=1 Tax=Curcuma longa TaxID=136217 RepID=UPI003D9F843A